MKLYFHYCSLGFSNCYILGTEYESEKSDNNLREAIIIDPGSADKQIIDFVETNDYSLRGILITHDHANHARGLTTLKRIYNTEIYAINHTILDFKTNMIKDEEVFNIGPFTIEVISVPGHSADSAVFKIENMLFTGDALSAGLVGSTSSSYGATVQMTALRSKVLALPGNLTVLPGHGPPSTLEAERHFNAGIQMYDSRKNQRPSFVKDIW